VSVRSRRLQEYPGDQRGGASSTGMRPRRAAGAAAVVLILFSYK
jgi:hypothetical protein